METETQDELAANRHVHVPQRLASPGLEDADQVIATSGIVQPGKPIRLPPPPEEQHHSVEMDHAPTTEAQPDPIVIGAHLVEDRAPFGGHKMRPR